MQSEGRSYRSTLVGWTMQGQGAYRTSSFCGHDSVDLHVPVAVGELDDLRQGEVPGFDDLLVGDLHLRACGPR